SARCRPTAACPTRARRTPGTTAARTTAARTTAARMTAARTRAWTPTWTALTRPPTARTTAATSVRIRPPMRWATRTMTAAATGPPPIRRAIDGGVARLPDHRFSSNLFVMKGWCFAGAGCLALVLAACAMDDPCAEPSGAACGGDPNGQWIVTGSCRDPAYQAPDPTTYYGQPDPMARQPLPEPTNSDWCS